MNETTKLLLEMAGRRGIHVSSQRPQETDYGYDLRIIHMINASELPPPAPPYEHDETPFKTGNVREMRAEFNRFFHR